MSVFRWRPTHEDFVTGFRFQREWGWLIATAFFFGELGAGLFLISLLVGLPVGMLVGWLAVSVGKNVAHLLYLGRPLRFWRAVLRPQTSWLARGFIATVVFMVFGLLVMAPSAGFSWIPTRESGLGQVIMAITVLSALVVLVYDGLAMAFSPSIAFWNTAMLPVLCATYGALGGVTLALGLDVAGIWAMTAEMGLVESVEIGLVLFNMGLIAAYLYTMYHSAIAARETVSHLLRGRYRLPFIVVVIGVGLAITLILALYAALSHVISLLIAVAVTELVGDYSIRILILKSGVYSPAR